MRLVQLCILTTLLLGLSDVAAAGGPVKLKPGEVLTAESEGAGARVGTIDPATQPWPIEGGACFVPPPVALAPPRTLPDPMTFNGSISSTETVQTATINVPAYAAFESALAVTMKSNSDYGMRHWRGTIDGSETPLSFVGGMGDMFKAKLEEGAGGMEYHTYAEHTSEEIVRRTAYSLIDKIDGLPFQAEHSVQVNSFDPSSWELKIQFYDLSDMETGEDAGQNAATAFPLEPGQIIKGHLGTGEDDVDFYRIMTDLKIGDEVEIRIIDTNLDFDQEGNPLFLAGLHTPYCEGDEVGLRSGPYPNMNQRVLETTEAVKRFVVAYNGPHYLGLDRNYGTLYNYEVQVNVTRGPEPEDPTLRFVALRNGAYEDVGVDGVGYGDVFYVEAEFEDEPQESPVIADLSWPDAAAPLSVTLEPVDGSGTTFRSEALRMPFEGQLIMTNAEVTP